MTGLRIRILSDDSLLWISELLPQGNLHEVHLYSGICFTAVLISTSFYLLSKPRSTCSNYHRFINYFGYLVITSLVISGWLKYFQPSALIPADLHYYLTLCLFVYLFLHSYIYLLQYGRKTIIAITPRVPKGWSSLSLSFVFWLCLVMVFSLQVKTRTLLVLDINYEQLIDIDGKADEPFWKDAATVTLLTSGGANFLNGQSIVNVKAVANKEEVYFLFRWQDPTQSLKHLPIIKQNGQWKVQQDGFQNFDERSFYEDKFAVMLSESCEYGGDNTTQLGPKPISGKPANIHGKGYHSVSDGKVRDMWHWKAVRTNEMYLADDNHFSSPTRARSAERRYSAGYAPDGKESGAYVMNWQWYKLAQITPKRLPIDPQLLSNYKSNHTAWILPWFETKPYEINNDTYSDGTEIPSVLYRSNRFEGDRADVRARGLWQDGYWTLELSRKRVTGSDYDIALQDDTCLWVSAFDHSQIAHTRHERPLKLVF